MTATKRKALIGAICMSIGSCGYPYTIYDYSMYAPGQIPLHATIDVFEDNSLNKGGDLQDSQLRGDFQRPLRDMVAEAMFMDLYRNGVFTSVSLKREKVSPLTKNLGPIFISGSINEFSHRETKRWLPLITGVTFAAVFGAPLGQRTTTIDLTIDITCIPTHTVIKEYPVRVQLAQWIGFYYGYPSVFGPSQPSDALTQAIDQFKKALVQDRDLILKECPS